MPIPHGPEAVLARVASRMRWADWGRRFSASVLSLSVIAAIAVLATRLTGLAPFTAETLVTLLGLPAIEAASWIGFGSPVIVSAAGILILAAAITLAWHDRPSVSEAARAIDRHQGTKDLFLTLTMLEGSAGVYQPLVARDAVARADDIQPARVVPLPLRRGLTRPALCLVGLAALVVCVPQLDPFGEVARADQTRTRHRTLQQQADRTRRRAEQLAKDDADAKNSLEVKQAIEKLKAALKKVKPGDQKLNQAMLIQQKKQLEDIHNRVNSPQLQRVLNRNNKGRQFGQLETPKLQKWTRELQRGSTESLKRELDKLKQDLKELTRLDDNDSESKQRREELTRKLQKKIRDIQSFATKNLDSKQPLSSALKRARQQLKAATAGDKELARKALQHLTETMDLAKQELQQLAQTARDLQDIEKSLQAMKMARKANDKGQLDGKLVENAKSLDDYRELYSQLMQQLGETVSEGEGTGNRGIGKGGEVPEDDSTRTNFKKELSKSVVSAGKVLLTLKTKGQSDSGDVKRAYRKSITTIQQGVSEAIDKEEIPKGYIEGIKRYFNSLDDAPKPTSPDTPANAPKK